MFLMDGKLCQCHMQHLAVYLMWFIVNVLISFWAAQEKPSFVTKKANFG